MIVVQRPHVPKFGNWDASGGNGAAYTAVFDNARAGKGSKMVNPNDPEENAELAAQMRGGPAAPPQRQGDRPPPRFRQPPNDSGKILYLFDSFLILLLLSESVHLTPWSKQMNP